MSNLMKSKCIFCEQTADVDNAKDFTYRFVECPICGRYMQQIYSPSYSTSLKDEIASYLYYSRYSGKQNNDENFVFLGEKQEFDRVKEKCPLAYYGSEDEIKAFYPKKFNDRINRILLGLAEKSDYMGDIIKLSKEQLYSAFFIKRFDKEGCLLESDKRQNQFEKIYTYLSENKLIDAVRDSGDECNIMLEPEGWKRVDELQQNNDRISNTVFIAMSFDESMKNIRETIKKVVTKNGFIPRIMDEIEHNHQIVPEMLYEIRESRFIVAELTGHNNGAYFEAGYALGYGKEVIQVCNKNKFDEDGHFDVKQINTVMWENQDDLYNRLDARIKATIL